MVHPTHVVSVLDHLITASDDPHSPAHTPTALIAPGLGTDTALTISMTITKPSLCATVIEALHDEAIAREAARTRHCPIAVDLNFPALFAAWGHYDSGVDVVPLIAALNALSAATAATDIYTHVRLNDHQPHDALPVALLGVFAPRAISTPSAEVAAPPVIHFHNTTRLDPHEHTAPPVVACHTTQLADLLDAPILGATA